MEYLILFAGLLAAGMLIFAKGLMDEKKRNQWQYRKLCENFGQPSGREYADGERFGIPRYFEKHQTDCSVDDITWNDLDLESLFLKMNDTSSSAGQEYLYYMLRTPVFEKEELEYREELISYFQREEKIRSELRFLFWQMGRTGKYSIYDYLDFLDDLGERSNTRQILMDLLYIPAVGLAAVNPSLGLFALMALLGVNVTAYFKAKRTIEPYLISFKYVLRTLKTAEQFVKINVPGLSSEQEEVQALLKQFGKLKRSAGQGLRSMGNGSSPLDVGMDYLNMLFHLDLFSFNRMLREVRLHRAEIDGLLTALGRIEALIAAAGFRASLETYCVPEFTGEGILIEGLYHPLLENPVKNDIEAQRGVLLTGSNASGKSTFLKSVAVNAVLAQTFHTCCADRYQARFWRVMTSMALKDNLGSGESYYIVEIKSLKRILDAAKKDRYPVLCFVDEVLRGTNTVERIAASTQILKSLHRPNVCCFAATHDIELTGLLEQIYDNYHFEEEIAEGDILFPYKLMAGKAATRNAIRLLAVMGYEETIIRKAEELAAHFVESHCWEEETG